MGAHELGISKFKTYFAGCDVHDKIHWGEIAREREAILDELKDGEPRRPYVRADSVLRPYDAFGLELSGADVRLDIVRSPRRKPFRTAIYLVVPVKVPAREPMSSPETPKSQSLTTPWRERRILEGLMSL